MTSLVLNKSPGGMLGLAKRVKNRPILLGLSGRIFLEIHNCVVRFFC